MPRSATKPAAKPTREERRSIRVNFVLQASLHEAERVRREETQILMSPEEYEWLYQVMDEAPDH